MNSVQELRHKLLKLKKPNYSTIDSLMRKIMKKYDMTAKELHYGFKKAHNNQTPDEYVKKMKTYEEFINEAYLYELTRQEKEEGKGKTPRHTARTRRSLVQTPKGSKTKWRLKVDQDTNTDLNLSPRASSGRRAAGLGRGETPTLGVHSSGVDYAGNRVTGLHRGVKNPPRPVEYSPPEDKTIRRGEIMIRAGKKPPITPEQWARYAASRTGFTQASKDWEKRKPTDDKANRRRRTRERMDAAGRRLGLR